MRSGYNPNENENDNNNNAPPPVASIPIADALISPASPPTLQDTQSTRSSPESSIVAANNPSPTSIGKISENGQIQSFEFYVETAPGDEDCGFWSIKALRYEVSETLLTLANDERTRAYLSDEIRVTLENAQAHAFPEWSRNWTQAWKDLQNDYRKALNNYQLTLHMHANKAGIAIPQLESSKAAQLIGTIASSEARAMAEGNHRRAQEAKQKLVNFCSSKEIFEDYVKSFAVYRVKLGYKSAILFAQCKNITLYVWKPISSILSSQNAQLEIVEKHVVPNPVFTVHIKATADFTDHDRLVPITVLTDQQKMDLQDLPSRREGFKSAIQDNSEWVRTQLMNFLCSYLSRVEMDIKKPCKPEFFFYLLDTFVASGNVQFMRKSAELYQNFLNKSDQLFEKNLEAHQLMLMLDGVKKLTDKYRANTDDPTTSANSPILLDRYQKLINDDFENESLIATKDVKEKKFETEILNGKFGDKLIWKGRHYRIFQEPYTGEGLLLKENPEEPYTKDSLVVGLNERDFGTSRENVAKSLIELIGCGKNFIEILAGASTEKGIFQHLLYYWTRNEKEEKAFGKILQQSIFAELSEMPITLDIIVRTQSILMLPSEKLKEAVSNLFQEQWFASWISTHSHRVKGFKDFSVSNPVSLDEIKLQLSRIHDFCRKEGQDFCTNKAVCVEYLNFYSKNPDLWLCEAGRQLYYLSNPEAANLKQKWSEAKPFSDKDIGIIFREILTSSSRQMQFSDKDRLTMRNFLENQPRTITLEILQLYALGSNKNLQEFTKVSISSLFDRQTFPKIGRVNLKHKHLDCGNNESINFIYLDGLCYHLQEKENLLKVIIKNFFEETSHRLRELLDTKIQVNFLRQNSNTDYRKNILTGLHEVIGNIEGTHTLLAKEIESLTKKRNDLLIEIANDETQGALEKLRVLRFLNSPSIIAQKIQKKLIIPILAKVFQMPKADIEIDIEMQELMGMELARTGWNIDELIDENHHSLFSLLLRKNVSADFFSKFLKKSPNPFGYVSVEMSFFKYLWAEAMKNRGMEDHPSFLKLFSFLNHVRDIVATLNYVGSHLINDLQDLKTCETQLNAYLADMDKYFEECREERFKEKPHRLKKDVFDKRGGEIERVFSVICENLADGKDFKKMLRQLKEEASKIARVGFWGRLSSQFARSTHRLIKGLDKALSSPTMDSSLKLYDERREAERQRVEDARKDAIDLSHKREIEKLQSNFLAADRAKSQEIIGLRNEIRIRDGRLQVVENKLAATETKLAFTETKLAVTETKLAVAETKLAVTETKLASTETKLAATEREMESFRNRADRNEAELAETRNELGDTRNEVENFKNRAERSEAELTFTRNELTKTQEAVEELKLMMQQLLEQTKPQQQPSPPPPPPPPPPPSPPREKKDSSNSPRTKAGMFKDSPEKTEEVRTQPTDELEKKNAK